MLKDATVALNHLNLLEAVLRTATLVHGALLRGRSSSISTHVALAQEASGALRAAGLCSLATQTRGAQCIKQVYHQSCIACSMTREVLWGAGVCFTPFLRQVATHVWIMLVYYLRVCRALHTAISRQHAIAPPCTFDIGHCALGSSSTRQYLGTRFPSSLRKCGSFFQRCAAADLSVPARPQRAGHVKNDGGGGPEQCSTPSESATARESGICSRAASWLPPTTIHQQDEHALQRMAQASHVVAWR